MIWAKRDNFMPAGWDENDLRRFLDFLLMQTSGTVSATSDTSKFTRSVQVANAITRVQANEVLFFLERIEAWTRRTAAQLGDGLAGRVTANSNIGGVGIPVPLPVKVVNGMNGRIDNQNWNIARGGHTFNINATQPLTPEYIDQLTRTFNKKLKQEARGGQF